jgi:DBF zinc finger
LDGLNESRTTQQYGLSTETGAAHDSVNRTSSAAGKSKNFIPLTGKHLVILDATGVHRPIMKKIFEDDEDQHFMNITPDTTLPAFPKPVKRPQSTSIDGGTSSATLDGIEPRSKRMRETVKPLPYAPPTFSMVDSEYYKNPPLLQQALETPKTKETDEYDMSRDFERIVADLKMGRPLPPLLMHLQKEIMSATGAQSYCERCETRYFNLEVHLKSDTHMRIADDDKYWRPLDRLAKQCNLVFDDEK